MTARLVRALLGLAVLAAVTGCAGGDRRSDDNRFGGFYGGASGGVVP